MLWNTHPFFWPYISVYPFFRLVSHSSHCRFHSFVPVTEGNSTNSKKEKWPRTYLKYTCEIHQRMELANSHEIWLYHYIPILGFSNPHVLNPHVLNGEITMSFLAGELVDNPFTNDYFGLVKLAI